MWVSIACTGKKLPRFNTLLIYLLTATVIKVSLIVSRKYEPHSFFFFNIQEQQNEHTLYNIFVTKRQASSDLFLRERLYGKVSALIVEIREF